MMLANQLLGVNVERSGAHPGLHSLAELLQHLVEKCACLAHLPDLIRILQADHSAAPSVLRMDWKISSTP